MKNLTEMFVNEAASLAEKAKKLYRDYDKIDQELDKINDEAYEIIKNAIGNTAERDDNPNPHFMTNNDYIMLPETITVVRSQPRAGEIVKINAVKLGYVKGTVTVGLVDSNGKWVESLEYDHVKYYTSVVAAIADQLK